LRAVGADAEDAAAQWFTARGYRLVQRNYFTRRGEIDIILWAPEQHPDAPALVFVEVKWRRDDRCGHGAEAVTPAKPVAMRNAARQWLADHSSVHPAVIRFDVLEITATGSTASDVSSSEITHYEGVEGW